MKINPNLALVKNAYVNQTGLSPAVTQGRRGPMDANLGAQIEVLRWDTRTQDLLYQTYGVGWRFPKTEWVDNRCAFRGWADPRKMLAGCKLTRWCLARQADDRLMDRISQALRDCLPALKGQEKPIECPKPHAYHPVGLVEHRDFQGNPQILYTREVPGADQFNALVPERLYGKGLRMAEALEKVAIESTVIDMSSLGRWTAVHVDSLKNPTLGIELDLGSADCERIHERWLARSRRLDESRDNRRKAAAVVASSGAPSGTTPTAQEEELDQQMVEVVPIGESGEISIPNPG